MGAALGIGTGGVDDRPGCDAPAHLLSPHVHQTESEPVDPVSGHCHRQLIETHRAGHRTDFLCGGAAHVVAGGRLDRPFPVFGLDEDQNAPEFKRLLVAGGQARRLTAGLSVRIATYP
ncbi:hypothetical protein [Rhodovulum sulfidophilum]|uniref:hypothetical protein n=1 Tax=Rhodovulum sulfidophilum TaxID=35806 RepID=UPI00117AE811|nr:hypothetical protein [Rhodovulum sulfidophilum]